MWEEFETIITRGIVNTKTGKIIAFEKGAQHRKSVLHVSDSVNPFPYTKEDFIILAAQNKLNLIGVA